MNPIRIQIDAETAAHIRKPVNGEGGFQDLLRLLQSRLSDQTITISSRQEAERIVRYSGKYGEGGFEGRLANIANEITQMMPNLS